MPAPNAKLRALVVPQEPEPAAQQAKPAECEANCAHHRPVRQSRAKLLKRVFELDLEHCPNCGAGELKIVAAILERPVIEKILAYLGWIRSRRPREGRARRGRTSLLEPLALSDIYRYGLRLPCSRGGVARCLGKPWSTSGATLRPGSNPANRERSKTFQPGSREPADASIAQ